MMKKGRLPDGTQLPGPACDPRCGTRECEARRGAARRTTFQRSSLFITTIGFPHLFTEPTDVQRAPLNTINLARGATPSNLATPLPDHPSRVPRSMSALLNKEFEPSAASYNVTSFLYYNIPFINKILKS